MKILDLYCGAGGASMGLHRAGHKVAGIDINPQPNYPFEFMQADAMRTDLGAYDAYWASPPCQAYTWASTKARNRGKIYPDLMAETRKRLLRTDKPFIIENVIGAPMRKDIILCGTMFGLNIIRHRLFEVNGFSVSQPPHPEHKPPIIIRTKRGTLAKREQYCSVAGHGGHGCSFKYEDWKEAMQIDWMTKQELTQAVPPAYSEYIGGFLK